MPLAIISV